MTIKLSIIHFDVIHKEPEQNKSALLKLLEQTANQPQHHPNPPKKISRQNRLRPAPAENNDFKTKRNGLKVSVEINYLSAETVPAP